MHPGFACPTSRHTWGDIKFLLDFSEVVIHHTLIIPKFLTLGPSARKGCIGVHTWSASPRESRLKCSTPQREGSFRRSGSRLLRPKPRLSRRERKRRSTQLMTGRAVDKAKLCEYAHLLSRARRAVPCRKSLCRPSRRRPSLFVVSRGALERKEGRKEGPFHY